MIEAEAALVVPAHGAAPPTTRMPPLALVTASQDMLATLTTAKTLLLLTIRPKFDRIVTLASFASA